MNEVYGRDLDLNLLRVFVVVARAGSVTQAASQLYLTQPAVSAALRRLASAVGMPLFVRQGRGLVLTQRGERLLEAVRPHLSALVDAALSPPRFDPRTSERTVRIGISDGLETYLLPRLVRTLATRAPHMKVVALPVQFRSVGDALTERRVDVALSVADALPDSLRRRALWTRGFVCLHDRRKVRIAGRLTERAYFAHEHVIVSYNGDLRGIVEDLLRKQRRVRCAVSSFHHVAPLISGSALLATVPEVVAEPMLAAHRHLAATPLPFELPRSSLELLWPLALDDDPASGFVRELAVELTLGGQGGR